MSNSYLRNTIQFPSKQRAHVQHGSYEGQFLIATPAMTGEVFAHSLIYLFAHNPGGAMGVMLNKPLDMVHHATLFQQLGIEFMRDDSDLAVHHGGPVEENRGFVLHSNDYATEDTLVQPSGISVTASMTILRDIARGKGPAQALLGIGYAGWAAGQLEAEIESNYWLTAPASSVIAFYPDDDAKHAMAAKSLGIDMCRYSIHVGHA